MDVIRVSLSPLVCGGVIIRWLSLISPNTPNMSSRHVPWRNAGLMHCLQRAGTHSYLCMKPVVINGGNGG